MKKKQVIPIPVLPMGMVNAFLVMGNDGNLLVDTGIPNSEQKVSRVLKQHGLSFGDIDLIIVTHAHSDHAGSANVIRKLSGAPILAHEAELPYYQQETKMTYCPTGWFGRFFLKTGLPLRDYHPFTPDILLTGDDTFELTKYGVNGAVFATPGHTEGSISVTLSDRNVLAGDLVASGLLLGGIAMRGTAKAPPFQDDAEQVAEQLLKLLETGMETFYLGHGGPLSSKEVKRYATRVLREEHGRD